MGVWADIYDWGEVYYINECIEEVGHIWLVGK